MKRSIFYILLVFSCILSLNANDLEEMELTGNVAMVITQMYNIAEISGSWIRNELPYAKYIDIYDDKGNLVDHTSYNADGVPDSKWVSIYNQEGQKNGWAWHNIDKPRYYYSVDKSDDKGKRTESIRYSYSVDGLQLSRTVFTYDERGNTLEVANYYSDGSPGTKYVSTYDENGNSISDTYYNWFGALGGKYTYSFNEEKKLTGVSAYDEDGRLKSRRLSTYDEKGNMTESANMNADGSLKDKNVYKYDEADKKGNWTQKTEEHQVIKSGEIVVLNKSVTMRTIIYYD